MAIATTMPTLTKARSNGMHVPASTDDAPTAQLVNVSPAMASEWLRTRHANRPLSAQRVRRIAAAIRGGLWVVNGASIVTCPDNRLLDGQHRCAGIEASGTIVQSLVAFGIDVRAFPSMDQGAKRTGADVVRIAGNAHASIVSSGLRWTYRYENMAMCSPIIDLNDCELLTYLTAHQGIVCSVSWGLSIKSLCPPGLGTMLHWKMSERDPAGTKQFFQDLSTGVSLESCNAAYQVRERYLAQGRAMNHMSVVERAAAICRAWNCRRGGRPMPQGRFVGGSAQFPRIE